MSKNYKFKIGKTKIGGESPCFIVAEIGINYDGDFNQALKLIDVAAEAGCNAVKFQLFRAKRMYTEKAGKYQIATGEKKDIIQIIKESELPHNWIPKLKKYANRKKLEFFSSVCDEISVNVLEKYKVDAFKLTSYAITYIPLLRHVARKKKPIIFSSGIAKLSEVAEAIELFEAENNSQIALMHCIGKYPAPLNSLNLNVLKTFQLAFPDIVVGYSDHSSDPVKAPRAAVALGARIIEKHITLDRNLPGPDHSFAVNPKELSLMVKAIRETEKQVKSKKKIKLDKKMLGTSKRETYPVEKYVRNFAYRSIFAIKDIKKGEKFSRRNVAVLRPGEKEKGLKPKYFELLIKGFRATNKISRGRCVQWKDILTS